jgi:transposase
MPATHGPHAKKKVQLTPEQRQEFTAICRQQSVAVAKVRRARVLLLSDLNHPEGRRRDWEIADIVGLSERQVIRIRRQFASEGSSVLDRKPRPPQEPKLDGVAEARLVALCCSAPPKGRERWTLQLLCDELGRLKVVESVCVETVRKCLKKTSCNPGGPSGSAFRNPTGRDSWPAWRRSSTSTRRPTTGNTR